MRTVPEPATERGSHDANQNLSAESGKLSPPLATRNEDPLRCTIITLAYRHFALETLGNPMKKLVSACAIIAVSVSMAGCANAGPGGQPLGKAAAVSSDTFEDLATVSADCEYVVGLMGGTPAMTTENAPGIIDRFKQMQDSPHPELTAVADTMIASAEGSTVSEEENAAIFDDLKPFCLEKMEAAEEQANQ